MLPASSGVYKASVVISYYKNIRNLELVLLALDRQTVKGAFEVIVSEDDNAKETVDFLEKIKPTLSFPITHVAQPDNGFRKCKALNNATEASTTDFIIFLDGDCIPHEQLVKEYISTQQEGRVLYGRRVMLSDKITAQLMKSERQSSLNFFNLWMTGCKRIEEGLYLKIVPQRFKQKNSGRLLGCNMAISKSDLMSINGFDEDFISPGGGEDSDIEWRLEASGKSFYSMKYRAIVYHLYHLERFTSTMEIKTRQFVQEKIQQGISFCKNGIKKNR